MELEVGLKITRMRDDVTSFSDLRIAKDETGPLFLSRETETMLFLIGFLKGFRRENIDININEGNTITIIGKKPVQEIVLMKWIVRKKDVELKVFKKVFRIPDEVDLDRIKARFGDDESTLTIIMPKLVKGIRGIGIEEVYEGSPEATQSVVDQIVQKEMERMKPEATGTVDDESQEAGNVEAEIEQYQEMEEVIEEHHEIENGDPTPQEKAEETKLEQENEIEQDNEPEEVRPERWVWEPETKQPTLAEETKNEEVPDFVEKPESAESELEMINPPILQVEQESAVEEKMPQGSENEEPATNVPGPTETEEKHPIEAEIRQESVATEPAMNNQETTQPESDNEKEQALDDQMSTQGEHQHPIEAEIPQESNNQEPETNGREQTVTELDHSLQNPPTIQDVEDAKTPQQSENQETANTEEPAKPEQDYIHNAAQEEPCSPHNEILEEAETGQVNPAQEQPESQEQAKPGHRVEGGAEKTKRRISKRSKLCPPLCCAGSALLISLIVLVINLIRSKKK